jgi:hypothetical protein
MQSVFDKTCRCEQLLSLVKNVKQQTETRHIDGNVKGREL